MPVERLFTEKDIQDLLEKNAAPPHGRRNAALIMGATYWGLTPIELSLLSVKDVLSENGDFYAIWIVPEHIAVNGIARESRTGDHALIFFEGYLQYRIVNNLGLSNLSTYRTLDPESKFFLNNYGEPYKLTPRKKGSGVYQPRSMTEQLKRMIGRTNLKGATPASFRDSFIRGCYDHGCQWNELKMISGIKHKRTIEKKIRPKEAELEVVFNKLYSRVKYPFNDLVAE